MTEDEERDDGVIVVELDGAGTTVPPQLPEGQGDAGLK